MKWHIGLGSKFQFLFKYKKNWAVLSFVYLNFSNMLISSLLPNQLISRLNAICSLYRLCRFNFSSCVNFISINCQFFGGSFLFFHRINQKSPYTDSTAATATRAAVVTNLALVMKLRCKYVCEYSSWKWIIQ